MGNALGSSSGFTRQSWWRSRTLIRLSFQLCDFLLTDEALDFIHAAKVPVTVFVLKNVLSTYSWHRPACDVFDTRACPGVWPVYDRLSFHAPFQFCDCRSRNLVRAGQELVEYCAHVLHAVTVIAAIRR